MFCDMENRDPGRLCKCPLASKPFLANTFQRGAPVRAWPYGKGTLFKGVGQRWLQPGTRGTPPTEQEARPHNLSLLSPFFIPGAGGDCHPGTEEAPPHQFSGSRPPECHMFLFVAGGKLSSIPQGKWAGPNPFSKLSSFWGPLCGPPKCSTGSLARVEELAKLPRLPFSIFVCWGHRERLVRSTRICHPRV